MAVVIVLAIHHIYWNDDDDVLGRHIICVVMCKDARPQRGSVSKVNECSKFVNNTSNWDHMRLLLVGTNRRDGLNMRKNNNGIRYSSLKINGPAQ